MDMPEIINFNTLDISLLHVDDFADPQFSLEASTLSQSESPLDDPFKYRTFPLHKDFCTQSNVHLFTLEALEYLTDALEVPFFCEQALIDLCSTTEFLNQLKFTFIQAEADSTQNLEVFGRVYKQLLNIISPKALEFLLDQANYEVFFGSLEYDTTFPGLPYRSSLKQAKFHNILHIADPELLKIVQVTFRLCFLKASPIYRLLDHPAVSTINQLETTLSSELVQGYLHKQHFRVNLLALIENQQSEALYFVQELCTLAEYCQTSLKTALFTSLWEQQTAVGVFWYFSSPENADSEEEQINCLTTRLIVKFYQVQPHFLLGFLAKNLLTAEHPVIFKLFEQAVHSEEALEELSELFIELAGQNSTYTVLCDVFYDSFLRRVIEKLWCNPVLEVSWSCQVIKLISKLLRTRFSEILRGFVIIHDAITKVAQVGTTNAVLAHSSVHFMHSVILSVDSRLVNFVIRKNSLKLIWHLGEVYQNDIVAGALQHLVSVIRSMPKLYTHFVESILSVFPRVLEHSG